MLGGNFGPPKEYNLIFSPPPQIPRKHPPSPSPPPRPHPPGKPPPPGIFNKNPPPPLPPGASDSPFPSPPCRTNKKYPKRPPRVNARKTGLLHMSLRWWGLEAEFEERSPTLIEAEAPTLLRPQKRQQRHAQPHSLTLFWAASIRHLM